MTTSTKSNDYEFPIVGIGASAGGLEALKEFFDHLPDDTGIAYVIIQHLSSDFKSMMPELLARNTDMPIHTAKDKQPILPNNVYLIPVKKNIIVKEKVLYHMERESSITSINLPIDLFFNSLGNDLTDSLAGIILSGTGTDGSRGLKMIKEAGGLIFAQDPESAKFNGMPNAAIATGLVEFVLEPSKMGQKLINYFSGNKVVEEDDGIDEENYYEHILFKIKKATGIDFTSYKTPTLKRRLEKKMNIEHLNSLNELNDFLSKKPEEVKKLAKEFLIGVTSFFRDKDAYDTIEKKVLPNLFNELNERKVVRMWSAGCSTGEESYTLALMINEYLEKRDLSQKFDFKIFASDIDEEALEKAGKGIYNAHQMAHLPPFYIDKYFQNLGENQFQVSEHIRKRIVFARHNIIKDPPFIRLDFVSCRNLLIYLESHVQKKVLLNFQFALNPKGILFLGTSESTTGVTDDYKILDKKWKIFESISKRHDTPLLRDNYSHLYKGLSAITESSKKTKRNLPEKYKKNPYEAALVDIFSPNCVFVDKDYNILYSKGNLNEFIHLPEREPSFSILKMTYEKVSLSIRNGMRRVLNEGTPINYKKIPMNSEATQSCDLVFYPIDLSSEHTVVLISFLKSGIDNEIEYSTELYNVDVDKRMKDLELDLDSTRQELQSALEELETSNEELQAANEELLASNEEMQSTNEELQSVNEELITVNSELQHKIKAVEEANNDVNNLLSSTEIGTVLLDADGCIRKFNLTAAQHFNLIEHDFGRPIYHLQKNFKFEGFKDAIKKVSSTGKKIEKEIYNQKHFYLLRILPYVLNKEVGGIVLTFIEITQQRETQKLLENANKELRRSNEYLDSFVYTAAHDLRAPLVNTKNLLNVFNLAPPEAQNDIKENLKESVEILENTLSGLIEIIESQKNGELTIEKISFKDLYDEVLKKLNTQINTANAELVFQSEGIETITYNKAYIRSILQNLISNAIKYRDPNRQPKIKVSITRSNNEFIRLSVEDNGIGMDMKKVKNQLFKPFKRFTKNVKGKGIGLNIIKNMIEKNGGKIDVESKEGVGSNFIVFLKPYILKQDY